MKSYAGNRQMVDNSVWKMEIYNLLISFPPGWVWSLDSLYFSSCCWLSCLEFWAGNAIKKDTNARCTRTLRSPWTFLVFAATILLTFTRTFATQCGLDGDEGEVNMWQWLIYFFFMGTLFERFRPRLHSLRTQTYFRLSLVPPKVKSANLSQKTISVT